MAKQDPPDPPSQLLTLERLRFGRTRRAIPFVQQLTMVECGAACLAMVLGYHGKPMRLEEVRAVVGVSRDGASALAILNAARWYGLRGRGVKVDMAELRYLTPAAILHWEFNHFVVFERLRAKAVDVVDPGFGRRRIPIDEFRKAFTGIALVLEPGEGFEGGGERERPVWRYVKRVLRESDYWQRLLVTSVLLQLFALTIPVLTGSLIDRVVARSDYHLLNVLIIGLVAIVGFQFLTSMVRSHLLLHMRTLLDARMSLSFLDHLVDLPYVFFQRRSTGDLMMRLNSNATIREILTSGVLSGLLDGALVCLYLVLLFAASSSLGALVLAMGLAQLAVFMVARRQQKELLSRTLSVQSRSQSYEVEMLSGIETLKAMGSEQRAVEHWSRLFVETLNVTIERGRLNALVDSLISMLRLGSPLAILVFCSLKVLDGEFSLGTMMGLSALAAAFLTPLSNLVNTASQLQLLTSYVERLEDVLQTAPEQDRTKVRQAEALKGRIELDRVSFRYGPMAPLVVCEVSVTIEPGQFVAVVGRSGSGKSTMANLLLGLYSPESGQILYDGVDLKIPEAWTVRCQLGIVTQRPYLFSDTIRANIALANPAAERKDIVAAARSAQIHDEIIAMPMGYDTVLIDVGASLSGGQRQRLALARALLHRPAILLLDEATSSLDTITERAVQNALTALRCTRIVIAHRLSTIVDADTILVMEGGTLVDRGTHAQLIARSGLYANLVMSPSAGPSEA